MPTITVIGLGPGDPDLLTRGALSALQSGQPVFLRTRIHPTTAALEEMALSFTTYDAFYERHGDFQSLYQAIVADLLDRAATQDLVYAVPGHPLVGEETVRRLQAQAPKQGISLRVVTAPSFLDSMFTALGIDPVSGLELLDALSDPQPTGRQPAVIMQIHNRQVASDLKLSLMATYPDEHPVTLVRAAGVPGEERVAHIPLYELDRQPWVDYLTSLYVPPLAEPPVARHAAFARLVEIMAELRSEQGCPWDREQTHESLRRYMLEEAYEAVEAINEGDLDHLADELGDVLLQVVFHAQLASENGDFTVDDVAQRIVDKLIRRHPHVFGDISVSSSEQVVTNWAAIKAQEKLAKGETPPASLLDKLPESFPALAQARALQKRAATVGFDWPDIEGPLNKVTEELQEIREAYQTGIAEKMEDELGDLLFAAVNVARFLSADPEVALLATCTKFKRRFRHMEETARTMGIALHSLDLAELDRLWDQAKRAETP